jgi:hypothetical protein
MGFTNTPVGAKRSDGLPYPLGQSGATVQFNIGNGFLIPNPGLKVRILLASLRFSPPSVMDPTFGSGEVEVTCQLGGLSHPLIFVYAAASAAYDPTIWNVNIPPQGLALDYGTGIAWRSTASPDNGLWTLSAEYDAVVPTG